MPRMELAACQMVLLVVQFQLFQVFRLIYTPPMMLEFLGLRIAPRMVFQSGQTLNLQAFKESVSRSKPNTPTVLSTSGRIQLKCP